VQGWHFAPEPIEWIADIPNTVFEACEGYNLWRQFIHVLLDGRAGLFYNSGYYGREQLYLKVGEAWKNASEHCQRRRITTMTAHSQWIACTPVFVAFLIVAFVSVNPLANADVSIQPTTALSANDFLNSIGVVTAVSRRGETLANTTECVRYLGVRWIRAGYESRLPVEDLVALNRQTGVRFSYGLMSGGADLTRLLDGARELAAVGALIAIEGNNEPNNWGITYRDEKGGRDLPWLPVARLQRDLYEAVRNDSVLKDTPVWSLSENGAETDNVGLQYLTVPTGAGTRMPDGTRYADYANCHNYMTHPGWKGLHDNQTWIAADPTSACRVDGLYGNYGLTWRHKYPGYSESSLLNLPRVTTETGVTLGGEITEPVQARMYLSVYLDQFKRGWKHTAIYLLRDRSDEGGTRRSDSTRRTTPRDSPRRISTT
jgi:hypothetical protein